MPKTAEQEKLEGCPGHRPLNSKAPVADTEIPPPPKWMGRISIRAYHDIVSVVGPDGMRVMAKSDKLALVMVCEAFEEWRRCRDLLEKDGRYFESGKVVFEDDGQPAKDADGNVVYSGLQIKRHPAVGDMQNAWSRIMTGLGKFGLTPYERQKVSSIGEPKKEETREDAMAKARQRALDAAKNKRHLQAVND